MELIKKRAEKALQHKKQKEANKLKSQITASTGLTPETTFVQKSSQILKINTLSSEKIQFKSLPSFEQTFIPNSFTIKNLDSNSYEAINESQFGQIQKNLNNRYERIHSYESIQQQLWMTFKSHLQKAEFQLFDACSQGNLLRVNEILSGKTTYPVDINCIGQQDRNCLHVVINNGENQDLVRALIFGGININHKTKLGRTPLIYATIKGEQKIVKILVDFKCELNLQDFYGNTALHYACMYDHYQIAQLLLINKIDSTIINNQNQLAFDTCNNVRMIELFENQLKYNRSQSEYNRTKYDDYVRKNSRADHVNKLLSRASITSISYMPENKILDQKISNNQKAMYLNSNETTKQQQNKKINTQQQNKKKMKFKRYQIMSSQLRNQIPKKQTSLVQFKQVDILGKGAFGSVVLVEHQTTKKLYAMKILNKTHILKQKLLKYVMTEKKVLSTINHPFVVKLHYSFQTGDKLILIMDYCPGGDLLQTIKKKKNLEEKVAKKYAAQIVLALECLHKAQILYRDLKPANVVLDAEGHACLTDFGLAKQAEMSHSFCGSIAYLSPEMLSRRGHTKAIDWYLLGVLIYQCVVGHPPYWDIRKQKVIQNIKIGKYKPLPSSYSSELKDLIEKLLRSNPSKRLGSQHDGTQVKSHPWFADVNWKQVYQRKQALPIHPKITKLNGLRFNLFTEKQIQQGKTIDPIKDWQFQLEK